MDSTGSNIEKHAIQMAKPTRHTCPIFLTPSNVFLLFRLLWLCSFNGLVGTACSLHLVQWRRRPYYVMQPFVRTVHSYVSPLEKQRRPFLHRAHSHCSIQLIDVEQSFEVAFACRAEVRPDAPRCAGSDGEEYRAQCIAMYPLVPYYRRQKTFQLPVGGLLWFSAETGLCERQR